MSKQGVIPAVKDDTRMNTLRIQTRLLALAVAGALMACLIGGVGHHG